MQNEKDDAGYAACIDALIDAGVAWKKQHPFAEPRFTDLEQIVAAEAGRPPGEKVAVIARLGDVIDRWADNADARLFLRHLDGATDGKATYLQVRSIMEEALRRRIERGQGMMPPGDWRCPSCGTNNDGFSNPDGSSRAPPTGAVGVCFYCAALQRVRDDAGGFEALSVQAFNGLPKQLRVQLRRMQQHVREKNDKRKEES